MYNIECFHLNKFEAKVEKEEEENASLGNFDFFCLIRAHNYVCYCRAKFRPSETSRETHNFNNSPT